MTLPEIARRLMTAGKGILAADQDTASIGKRFAACGIANTDEARRDFRELLFSSPAMQAHISGVILYDETLGQQAAAGRPMADLIASSGALIGIKLDLGQTPLPFSGGELVTEGLDGLAARIASYHAMGARFAKWRAVVSPAGPGPSDNCVRANAHALARYAALCQEGGLVPIVEPDILMDFDNGIEASYQATSRFLVALYEELAIAGVDLDGTILKPNMATSGKRAAVQSGRAEVAERTLAMLKKHVPDTVAGIAFLSGGQSDADAAAHLDLMARRGPHPWPLTFSYGRALWQTAMTVWGGRRENWHAAQAAFNHRARMNALAAKGEWSDAQETGG